MVSRLDALRNQELMMLRDALTPVVSRYSRGFVPDFGAFRMLFFSTSNTDAVS